MATRVLRAQTLGEALIRQNIPIGEGPHAAPPCGGRQLEILHPLNGFALRDAAVGFVDRHRRRMTR